MQAVLVAKLTMPLKFSKQLTSLELRLSMSKDYISSSRSAIKIRDVMRWIVAIDSWDYCDGTLLAELVIKEVIPEEVKPLIGSIIDGSRIKKTKAAVHLKIPANERMRIAESLSINLGLIDTLKTAETITGETLLEWQADKNGIEPIESKRWLENQAQEIIKDAAKQLSVSVETIENLLRDFRRKIANFPDV